MKILKYNELNEELTYGETLYKYEFSDTIRDYFLDVEDPRINKLFKKYGGFANHFIKKGDINSDKILDYKKFI